jgi:hypothetical protein
MPKDELVDLVTTQQTTRRTIVTTGAKLAYAAPVVAASFKVATQRASALSPGTGSCVPFNPVDCTFTTQCPGCDLGSECCTSAGCTTSVAGNTFCIAPGIYACGSTCTTDEECGAGSLCGISCCNGGADRLCFPVADCGADGAGDGISGGAAVPAR